MPASSVAGAAAVAVIIVVVPCPLATLNHRSGKYLLRAFAAFYFWVSFRFTVGQVPKQSGGLHLPTIYLSLSPSLLLTVSLCCLPAFWGRVRLSPVHILNARISITWLRFLHLKRDRNIYVSVCMYFAARSSLQMEPFRLSTCNEIYSILSFNDVSRLDQGRRPVPGAAAFYYCFFMLLPLVFSLCFSLTLSVSRGSVFLFQSTTNGEC